MAPLNQYSPMINQIHTGRIKASSYLMGSQEVKRNRKLWDSLKLLSDIYRQYVSHQLSVEVLKHELQQAENKTKAYSNSLEDQLYKTGLTYSSLVNMECSAEKIISADKLSQANRDLVNKNCFL